MCNVSQPSPFRLETLRPATRPRSLILSRILHVISDGLLLDETNREMKTLQSAVEHTASLARMTAQEGCLGLQG